jgi:hypothetical protein
MNGPGDYVADATEGIVRVEDLPPPRIERRSRVYRRRRCPFCGGKARRCGMAIGSCTTWAMLAAAGPWTAVAIKEFGNPTLVLHVGARGRVIVAKDDYHSGRRTAFGGQGAVYRPTL